MGNHASHVSGLESRFLAQVANAAAGLTRTEADVMVRKMVAKYADRQGTMPVGLPFDQVYDLDKIQPTVAWQQIYDEVCEEIEVEIGLSLAL
jgi:hypothetical protein